MSSKTLWGLDVLKDHEKSGLFKYIGTECTLIFEKSGLFKYQGTFSPDLWCGPCKFETIGKVDAFIGK